MIVVSLFLFKKEELANMESKRNKVISVVGFGNVGQCVLYQLLSISKQKFTINVIEPDPLQYGSFLDLSHTATINNQHYLLWNNEELLELSDFIFHCAGPKIPLKSNRLTVVKESMLMTTSIFKNFKTKVAPIIIVIANPVDIVSHLLYRLTSLDSSRIIGVGTLLDTMRMNYYLGEVMKTNKNKINSLLLGEHGASVVLIKSQSFIGDQPLLEVFDKEVIKHCFKQTKSAALTIKETQGATYYAVAKCATTILEGILDPIDHQYPLSILLPDQLQKTLNCSSIFMSIPATLDENGVTPIDNLNYTNKELKQLKKSAQILENYK